MLKLSLHSPESDSYGPISTPLLIGRSEEADIQVSDIWASRQHCQLEDEDGKVVLRDLNSRHGTLVNGEPIEDISALSPGDEIAVGLTKFKVHWSP